MIAFNKTYTLLTFILFVVGAFIAFYMHDAFIRPYGGDFLVVIFLYCLIKSLFNIPVMTAACGVLLFAYVVEITQYFNLISLLDWEHSRLANLVLGNSFSMTDILLYTLGALLIIVTESIRSNMRTL